MLAPQIIKLSGTEGRSLFMIWEPEQQKFLSLRDRNQWPDWNHFKTDLRGHWDSDIDEGGSHTDQRFREYLERYERNAPSHLTSPPTAPESRARKNRLSRGLWAVAGLFAFFVFVVGSLLWDQGMAPLLGRLGIIEYKSAPQERYERFLAGAQGCKPQKTVSTSETKDIPQFQVFDCPGGQEKIWAYKVEVVKRSANGPWVLEP